MNNSALTILAAISLFMFSSCKHKAQQDNNRDNDQQAQGGFEEPASSGGTQQNLSSLEAKKPSSVSGNYYTDSHDVTFTATDNVLHYDIAENNTDATAAIEYVNI